MTNQSNIRIEDLHNYSVLVNGDHFFSFTDVHTLGAVTLVFPEIAKADTWLERLRPGFPKIKVIPLGDPWKAMRKAAGERLAGFQVSTGGVSLPDLFLFMVRPEEAGADLPTVLTHVVPPGMTTESLTRMGLQAFSLDELRHWTRFDIIDHHPSFHKSNLPFHNWNQGDPLYEIVGPDTIATIWNIPILGSYVPMHGAIPFFTSQEEAWDYLIDPMSAEELYLIGGPEEVSHNSKTGFPMNLLKVVPIYNLKTRLEQIQKRYNGYICSIIDFCIDPAGIRPRMAWGSFLWGEEFNQYYIARNSRFNDLIAHNPGPWIRTFAGLWRIDDRNRFVLIDPVDWWTGFDTVFWSGGQSKMLLPLSRSLVVDESRSLLDLDGASDKETAEIVAAYLAGDHEQIPPSSPCRLHWYTLVIFPVVCNAPGIYLVNTFDTVLEAIHYLIEFERTRDRSLRITGTVAGLGCGFTGNHFPEIEEMAGESFRLGLTRIGTRIITRGYQPSDSNDIVALCNSTLRTVRIDLGGYLWDLLTASDDDQRAWLLRLLNFEPEFWDQWYDGTMMPVDPSGLALVHGHLGNNAEILLSVRSLHFLASALAMFEERGYAPGLDYAPITIEIVKVLETELGEIFHALRETLQKETLDFDPKDRNQVTLNNYIYGSEKLSFGTYLYLLKGAFKSESGLTERIKSYFLSLPNADYLLGKEFLDKVGQKVLHKFRNGGAHDSPVDYNTCCDCINLLVGTPANPGAISRVIAWKEEQP